MATVHRAQTEFVKFARAHESGYGDLPTSPASRTLPPGQSTVYDASYRDAPIRVIALAGASTGAQKSIPFTVYVAETTQARQKSDQSPRSSTSWLTAIQSVELRPTVSPASISMCCASRTVVVLPVVPVTRPIGTSSKPVQSTASGDGASGVGQVVE